MLHELVGTSIVLSLDGQKVTGKVTAVQEDKLVVRLTILQPAKAYQGVTARAKLPGGQEVSFDLGGQAYYSELLVEVPLPVGMRAIATPRPTASVAAPPSDAPLPVAAVPVQARPVRDILGAKEPTALEKAKEKPALNKVEADEEPPAPPPPKPTEPVKDDRRHFFRFAVDCDVDLVENVGHTREYVRAEGRTLNLSGGGMLAEFEEPVPPGNYRFRLYLNEEEAMLLTGKVIKKGEGKSRVAAIEFVDLHEADRSKLIRFIFNMMRTLKQAARGLPLDEPKGEAKEKKEEKGHNRRRERFFRPGKIRYW
ncbi:MAG: hypothetical protein JWM80_2392 [Cyanobacteria bacterium RYN_339]|nr:hypothetical protein [Cyanobacteria bacterium RYN_339]